MDYSLSPSFQLNLTIIIARLNSHTQDGSIYFERDKKNAMRAVKKNVLERSKFTRRDVCNISRKYVYVRPLLVVFVLNFFGEQDYK